MQFKRSLATGFAAALGLAGALALGAPAQAESSIDINPDHIGRTADTFETSCGTAGQIPEDKPADYDGWVFILPANGEFKSVTVVFADEQGVTQPAVEAEVVSTGNSGSLNHAYYGTPSGWTIVEASAVIEGTATFFNVTHTCPAGTPNENPSSPGEEQPTSPSDESPSAPGSESPTAPGEASTTPAGSTLPTTGTSLTVAIVAAAALAAAGATLFLVQRRRREAADW